MSRTTMSVETGFYRIPNLPPGRYQVKVSNPVNFQLSREARLTVNLDQAAPTLATVTGTSNQVRLTFSEPVDPASVTNLINYSAPGLTIDGAIPDATDARSVILTTSAQSLGL